MLLFPALAGAQALPFTAADYDAASLGKAGTNLTETGSIANASFANAAAIPFSDSKFDVSAGYVMWQPTAVKSNVVNVGAAYNANNKFGVAVGFMYGMNQPYDITDGSGERSVYADRYAYQCRSRMEIPPCSFAWCQRGICIQYTC